MAGTRWEQWRLDSTEQQLRNCASDLDGIDRRQDRHDRWHQERQVETTEWQKHVDDEIDGLKKILLGFIVSAARIIIVAALNVAVLIVQGG